MALYAMGDLHLSLGVAKPMDVFGGVWEGYLEKLNQGVSVIGPGDLSEAQDVPGQLHHLAFFRLSVTGYGQLDLGGRVLIEWNSAVLRCAEDHASAVSYGNAGGKIGIKKQLFYRNCIWLELPDQRLHVTADLI